jgi:uncharacterized protein YjaZ
MANSDLIQVEFYFPKKEKVKSKKDLANLIVDEMSQQGSTEYAGYLDEKSLYEGITEHLGDTNVGEYKPIDSSQKKYVKKLIKNIVKTCNEILPIPVKNFIFVFPWFPSDNFSMFNGSIGLAPYTCVIHIFIDTYHFSDKGIRDTICHELNHTIYYQYHPDSFGNYNLLDNLIIEGLAENFREDILQDDPAPWAVALNKEEAFRLVEKIKPQFNTTDLKILEDVLFGSKEYKRWTGYSVGYWLVKAFKEENKNYTWESIMRQKSANFLKTLK